ncbi:MAG: glycosyltransferase family 2 protein [Gemmatimonadaceae bacterium]|nr:glycosyltransferase family 2 protein [Acetobacteraceae bacterium]
MRASHQVVTESIARLRGGHDVVVAVPARDEEAWIGRCLTALARQRGVPPPAVLVLVNNSIDQTAVRARATAAALGLRAAVIEHRFATADQTAGQARRLAMQQAAAMLATTGTLLCTDADAEVAPDWLAANLINLRRADAVAGRALLDPADAASIPAALHDDDARECAYAALLDEIDSLIDPNPFDPWPRHTEHSGASICVSLEAFRRVGGVPPVPVGEDRAFFTALQHVDARIRHAPDVRVTVSGRIQGRAAGGMADTIRRRLVAPDPFIDDALEPAATRFRRSRLRAALRPVWAQGRPIPEPLRSRLACDPDHIDAALAQPTFGRAWAIIEANSPHLRHRAVAVAALPRETAAAERLLTALRVGIVSPGPGLPQECLVGALEDRQESRRQFETARVIVDQPAILARMG